MTELADVFAELDDPRAVNARRHSLHDIRFIALCAVISGGQTCSDMELFGHANRDLLQSFLELENGIPNHDTFSRVLGMLDPEAFRQWFLAFMGRFAERHRGQEIGQGSMPGWTYGEYWPRIWAFQWTFSRPCCSGCTPGLGLAPHGPTMRDPALDLEV